jgi:hypothetical protein
MVSNCTSGQIILYRGGIHTDEECILSKGLSVALNVIIAVDKVILPC